MYFSDLELSDDILDALYDMHFDECTPIQEQCIPPILEGRDVMGIAQTGTGKPRPIFAPADLAPSESSSSRCRQLLDHGSYA